MTKTMKRFFTVIIAITMFATMTTSAFATCSHFVIAPQTQDAAHRDAIRIANKFGGSVKAAYELGLYQNNEIGYLNGLNMQFDNRNGVTRLMTNVLRINGIDIPVTCDHGIRIIDCTPEVQIFRDKSPVNTDGATALYKLGIMTYDNVFTCKSETVRWLDGSQKTQHYYEPETKATREEMALLVTLTAKYMGITEKTDTVAFNDANSFKSDDAKAAAQFCANYGLMSADENGKFNPTDNLTPEQAATVALRLHNLLQANATTNAEQNA